MPSAAAKARRAALRAYMFRHTEDSTGDTQAPSAIGEQPQGDNDAPQARNTCTRHGKQSQGGVNNPQARKTTQGAATQDPELPAGYRLAGQGSRVYNRTQPRNRGTISNKHISINVATKGCSPAQVGRHFDKAWAEALDEHRRLHGEDSDIHIGQLQQTVQARTERLIESARRRNARRKPSQV